MPPAATGTDAALLALALTIRTRSGPRLVFHYPAQPSLEAEKVRQRARRDSVDTISSQSTESGEENTTLEASDIDDDAISLSKSGSSRSKNAVTGGHSHGRVESSGGTASNRTNGMNGTKSASSRRNRVLREEGPEDYQDDYEDDDIAAPRSGITAGIAAAANATTSSSGSGPNLSKDNKTSSNVGWDTVFDYSSEALAKLLCPGREAKKKRFEVGVGDLTFLGSPTFVREEGGWRKKRAPRKSRTQASGTLAEGAEEIRKDMNTVRLGDDLAGSAGSQALTMAAESFTSQAALSEPASETKSTSTDTGADSEMSMYNVVFVMNPHSLQHQTKVTDMYENVVKKFAKALKYEQARTGYVWSESRKILDMKSKGREEGTPMGILWSQITTMSTLARSIAHIFNTISTGKIAHVSIGETVDASMQIPQTMSTPFPSTPGEPQPPGLWVTTASMLEEDGSLSPHAALLLLEDKETMLKEIEGDKRELAAPLSYFIREVTPTKSLQKMAIRLSLRLPDLQFLARHLIYWRRARAIPPLHIRDIYMVSPLADMKSIPTASEAFERRFPGLPGLPQILQSLSSRPLPYGYLIPSQDHKPVYMEILAWLLRGNWVTALRTFAWVRVSGEIKARAAMQAKIDDRRGSLRTRSKRGSEASGQVGHALERKTTNDSFSEEGSMRGDRSTVLETKSPHLRPIIDADRSETGSVGSHRTTVQALSGRSPLLKIAPHDAPSPFSMNGKATAPTEDGSAVIPPLELSIPEPSIILNPQKASTEESRWLALIRDSLSDEDLRTAWPLLSNYFDGQWALEDVAAREGMKRSRVANLVARLEREGVLCIARHW